MWEGIMFLASILYEAVVIPNMSGETEQGSIKGLQFFLPWRWLRMKSKLRPVLSGVRRRSNQTSFIFPCVAVEVEKRTWKHMCGIVQIIVAAGAELEPEFVVAG